MSLSAYWSLTYRCCCWYKNICWFRKQDSWQSEAPIRLLLGSESLSGCPHCCIVWTGRAGGISLINFNIYSKTHFVLFSWAYYLFLPSLLNFYAFLQMDISSALNKCWNWIIIFYHLYIKKAKVNILLKIFTRNKIFTLTTILCILS